MKKHVNLPFFIPHLGCPNACVFCDQHTISGADGYDAARFRREAEAILSSLDPETTEVEIAFFGGSFTGIDRDLMLELLNAADGFLRDGRAASVRVSTRPDYIDGEILGILKEHGVKTVELGIQSASDRILAAAGRGHTFSDTVRACRLLTGEGFRVVGQMMIGLPESTGEDERHTAEAIAALGCTAARIYPTVVLRGTALAAMAEAGTYVPLSLPEAVRRSADVYGIFLDRGVQVIRVGLCAGEQYREGEDGEVAAGEYHPAIGELVKSRVFLDKITETWKRSPIPPKDGTLRMEIPRGFLSALIGKGGEGRRELLSLTGAKRLHAVETDALKPFSFRFPSV